MVLVLALVLGLIYLVFRIMKRVSKPKVASDSELKILASTSLGQGRAVHVIGVGSKAYLVGATDSAVSLIAEVEDKELIDELELKAATEPPKAKTDFAAIFTSLLGKGGKPVGKAKSSRVDSFSPEYLAQQRERLKKF
jgi:flagellar protein FliO/FliZ